MLHRWHRMYGCWAATALVFAVPQSCRESAAGPGAKSVKDVWFQPQFGYSRARPAISANLVYFGTGDGRVIARATTSGTTIWNTPVSPDPINGANLIARSGVVVAPAVSSTIGLEATSGRVLWRYSAPIDTAGVASPSQSKPGTVIDSRIDADDEMVYIPAWGASISALELRTGAVRWVWQPGIILGDTAASGVFRSGSMGVAISGDSVYGTLWHFLTRTGGASEAWVVALDRLSGREFWRVKLPYIGSGVLIEAAPRVYSNLLVVHTLSGRTYALDRSTGQIVWEFVANAAELSTVAGAELYGDVVYVDGGDRRIHALRVIDGTPLWTSSIPSAASRDLLATPRRIIFSTGGTLFILDRTDGKVVAIADQPHTQDPLISSAAAFSEGRIFVTVADAAWCFSEP